MADQGTRVLDLPAKNVVFSTNDEIVIVYGAGTPHAQTALVSANSLFSSFGLTPKPNPAIIVAGSFTQPPIWLFKNPNAFILNGNTYITSDNYWWLDQSISDSTIDFSSATAVTLTNIGGVVGNVVFSTLNEASLTSISLSNAEIITGNLVLGFNSSVFTSLNVSSLAYVGGNVNIYNTTGNSGITSLAFPDLNYVAGSINLANLNVLTAASLANLTYVGGTLSITNSPTFLSATANNLVSVGSLAIQNNSSLTSIIFPSLSKVTNSITVSDCINLTYVTLSGITSMSSDLIFSGTMNNLLTLSFGNNLKIFGGNVNITAGALVQSTVDNILMTLASLNGSNGTTTYSNKTISILGNCAVPGASGTAAIATLRSRSCTVNVNGGI